MLRSLLKRIRRNHALEHATLNLISNTFPHAQILGLSTPRGYTIYTSLTAKEVIPATMEALKRLQSGEGNLRVHQNCGTNLVVTAGLTTLATLIGIRGKTASPLRKHLDRLPHLILLNVLALLAAPSLGEWVQANVTTDADLTGAEIDSVITDTYSGLQRIRVYTRYA